MTRFENFFYRHLHLFRRTMQWSALVLIFLVPFLNKNGINWIIGTFYSISVGHLDMMDPSLLLQNIVLTNNIYFVALLAGMIPIVIALLLGKVFCSWICPYNLISEYLMLLRKKVFPEKKRKINRNPKPHYYWLIFGIIVSIVMISGLPIITLVSFPGLISSQAADVILNGTIGIEIALVLLVLFIEFFIAPRFWCKYACPVGAALSLFRYKHTLRVSFNPQGCTCENIKDFSCNVACPLNLDPRKTLEIYPYCFNCGECIYSCHKLGGTSLTFSFQTKIEPKIKRLNV